MSPGKSGSMGGFSPESVTFGGLKEVEGKGTLQDVLEA